MRVTLHYDTSVQCARQLLKINLHHRYQIMLTCKIITLLATTTLASETRKPASQP